MILNKYIFSYNDTFDFLDRLSIEYPNFLKKQKPIGSTVFNYDINYYTLGNGNKHVVLIAATHGCELVTLTYILDLINTILVDNIRYYTYLNEYTFHIIPILNPEGYIISSSQVLYNIASMNKNKFESYSKKYLELYEADDVNVKNSKKTVKLYKSLMTTSLDFINDIPLREQVSKILKNCNLDSSVLPIWSSNGMGIDINANSISNFELTKQIRDKQKFLTKRYNDIPTDKASPKGFPGEKTFDENCPENLALYNFISNLFNTNNLKLFISFHSTGAQIYGYPDKDIALPTQIETIVYGMNCYTTYTNYMIMNEKIKFGVMDYYRAYLNGTVTLTVELSKLSGNPIGPFANLRSLDNEFEDNVKALFYTLNCII